MDLGIRWWALGLMMRFKHSKNPLKIYGLFGYNYWHLITHPHKIITESYYNIKWFIQRGYRGYADCDAWSIGDYLNSWLPNAIAELKKSKHGTPAIMLTEVFGEDYKVIEPPQEDWDKCHARWQEIMSQMIQAFKAQKTLDECKVQYNSKKWKELEKVHKIGMELFAKYYMCLWD